ncbi:MAG: GNAT family N-acetyltransferase [Bacteroidota bacterium]
MNDDFALLSENLFGFYRLVAEKTGIPSGEEAVFWIKNNAGKWPRWVVGQNFDQQSFEEEAMQVIGRIRTHELPPYWNVVPGYGQDALGDLLKKNRFREVYTWTGMSVDTGKGWPEQKTVSGLELCEVSSEEDLESFVSVVNATLLEASPMDLSLARLLLHVDRFRMVTGRIGGKAVASSAIFLSGRGGGIYFVATLPEYRNRGIGSAVTAKCLEIARREGVATVILHASAMGEAVYRKLGFETVAGGQFHIYWLVGREYR